MNTVNESASVPEDDELSLLDMVLFLKNGWKTLLVSACTGLALASGAAAWPPAKYEVSAMIEGR